MKYDLITRYASLLSLLLLLVGCSPDELMPSYSNTIGQLVPVRLSLSIPPAQIPQSALRGKSLSESRFSVRLGGEEGLVSPRAVVATTSILRNLWIFQFDAAGNRVHMSKISSTNPSVNGAIIIDVELVIGKNQTIYLVALGKQLDEDLSAIVTLSALETYPIDYLEPVDGAFLSKVKSEEDMIYAGSARGIEIVQLEEGGPGLIKYDPIAGFAGGIELSALLAKVSLHFTFTVEDMSLLSLNMKSVAGKVYISPLKSEKTLFHDLSPVDINLVTEKDAQKRWVCSWYVAANMQGEVPSILSEKDRIETKSPKNASYIDMVAIKQTDAEMSASYSIYIGNNNTTSFDLEKASHYKIYTDVDLPLSETDGRVEVAITKLGVELLASSKGLNGIEDVKYDFDAHFDQREMIVTSSAHKIIVELLHGDDQSPVGADFWVKISRSSNYTNAYRSKDLSTRREIKVLVPGRTSLYLYCDEYIKSEAPKRRVYIRVTIIANEDASPIYYEYFIDQRSLVSCGYWGGVLDPATGKYSKVLGLEEIEEYSVSYKKGVVMVRTTNPYYGYNAHRLYEKGYDTYNSVNGLEATRLMAINPDNLTVGGGVNGLEEPRKNARGELDLYQYTNKFFSDQENSRVYAARYCYDKNRDKNGNGVIDYLPNNPTDNELLWYLPSQNQMMSLYIIRNTVRISNQVPGLSYWSTREQSETTALPTRLLDGITRNLGKTAQGLTRCVREIDGI